MQHLYRVSKKETYQYIITKLLQSPTHITGGDDIKAMLVGKIVIGIIHDFKYMLFLKITWVIVAHIANLH